MLRETIELIGRVRNILGTNPEFFDAMKKWYGDAKLAQKVIRLMVTRSRCGARVLLTVNGHLLAGDALTVTPRARHMTWVIPANLLVHGDNDVTVSLDTASKSSLYLESVAALQERGLPRQDIDLSVTNPAPAPSMVLAEFADTCHAEHCCCVGKNGYMSFRLLLKEQTPLTFVLDLPDDGSEAWMHDLREVTKEVFERVRDKCRELEDEKRREGKTDLRLARRLADEIRDLEVYSELQRLHIEPALQSKPDETLDEIMKQLGDPDRLVRKLTSEFSTPVVTVQAGPPQPQEFARVEVVRPGPQVVSHAPPRMIPRRSGSGFIKTCVILLTTLGTLAAGATALWSKVIEPALAQMSNLAVASPAGGQTPPTGASGSSMVVEVSPGTTDPNVGVEIKEPTIKPLGNFAGDWDTRLGYTSYGFPRQMTLRQSGDVVEGEFSEVLSGQTVYGKILDGKVVGNTLKFRWVEPGHRGSQPGEDGQGSGEFELSSDGKGFSGTYTGFGCENGNGWRGWRK